MFEELLSELLVAVGGVVIGAIAGWAICTIVCTVYEKITIYNLPEMIRTALRNSKEEKAQKLLREAIKRGKIKDTEHNCITVDIFCGGDTAETAEETVRVKLKTTEGVDASIQKGMSVSI